MRIYLSPAVSNLLSALISVTSLGIALFIGFKAFQTFSSDSALDQIPAVLQESTQ